MIVRLKGACRQVQVLVPLVFQFYDSPIKSFEILECRLRAAIQFQFYDSPIKSRSAFEAGGFKFARFNSMIVRLKVKYLNVVLGLLFSFNSMIVRLKAVRNDKKHY